MLFLSLLSLALVHCSSVDEMPARNADGTLSEDDSVLRCNHFEGTPNQNYDARNWNRVLYLNEELRQASGISRVTSCEEARVIERVFYRYLQDHPEFVEVFNERSTAERRLHETAPPEVPPRKPLDEWKP
jgi:hypothetical protein